MTTEVQDRLIAPPSAPHRPRGVRAWTTFFVTVLLAAVVIGIIAALLGNAVRAVSTADAAEAQAQVELDRAQADVAAAEQARLDAEAAIEARRQAIIDELAAQPREPGFSLSSSSPAFAELETMEASVEQNEAAAVDAAHAAEDAAAAQLAEATAGIGEAQRQVDALIVPLWIAIGASTVLLGILLWVAIVRTRRARRRLRY